MSLKQNTTDLQSVLDAITSLPDYIDPAKAPIPADAITALTEKGVEVASGADVSTLAGLIAAIESGGATTGSFTLTTASKNHILTHGLGKIPTFLLVVRQSKKSSGNSGFTVSTLFDASWDATTGQQSLHAGHSNKNAYEYGNVTYDITTALSTLSIYSGCVFWDANNNTVTINTSASGSYQMDTNTYFWVAY